jgi:hypothetical protein
MNHTEFVSLLVKLKECYGPTKLARELEVNPTELYRWTERGTTPMASTIARLQPKIEVLFSSQEPSGIQATLQNHEISNIKVAFTAPQQTIFLMAQQLVGLETRLKEIADMQENLINESIQLNEERKALEEALVTLRKRFPSKEVKA